MRKTVLMVAFHFPPAAMGSGHLRTLGFARYLPESGWDPIVLSANALAYPRTSAIADGTIPSGCEVHRAFGLDAGRHFAIAGKYPGFIAQPDRWISWWPAATWRGLQLIRKHRVDAIWSTYPIMTAHCVAHGLNRITSLPWVADFRDPVASSVSTANRFAIGSQRRWEQRVLDRASRVIFTTPGALRDYATRYPEAQRHMSVIENGYDEAAFTDLPVPPPVAGRPLRLVHSGLLYEDGRNPAPLFEALARLMASGSLNADAIQIVLRASGSVTTYAREIDRLGLGCMVSLAPAVPYRDALMEQAQADALLLFQGSRFNRQIPAKAYEYLRIGRPILALVDPGGNTAAMLHKTGGAELLPIDDTGAIQARLKHFVAAVRGGVAPHADPGLVAEYSRRAGAATLAEILTAASGHTAQTTTTPGEPPGMHADNFKAGDTEGSKCRTGDFRE